MTPRKGSPAKPDPELLAAYLDGEFEGRAGVDDLRRKVEAWLETDPSARALIRDYRHLRQTWAATSPREPGNKTWNKLLSRVRAQALNPRRRPTLRLSVPWLLGAALAGCVAAFALFSGWPDQGPVSFGTSHSVTVSLPLPEHPAPLVEEEVYILPVAHRGDVTFLQVDGADTGTLVVGQLPVDGTIQLVDPEDVTINSMEPAEEDQMVPAVRVGARSPMIWSWAKSD